uniref:MSP domain-containing protein n=1 Tax=Ascaris lumbricoides TaxID=6252 RepID=A0A0M3HKI7_ASCLU
MPLAAEVSNFAFTGNSPPKPCQRKVTYYIPDSYVSSGKTPSKIYDIGTVDLAPETKGETRDCIH